MTELDKELWEAKIQQKMELVKRAGAADKYDCAGIYCIKVNGRILYIGKSMNMLRRIAQHLVDIDDNKKTNKYLVFRGLIKNGYRITFDVLYSAIGTEGVEDEIGQKEGELIRQYLPVLNYQVPKEENYHSFSINKRAKTITTREVIAAIG